MREPLTIGTRKPTMNEMPRQPKAPKPALGRPPRDPSGASERQVKIRLTEAEHEAWTRAAEHRGTTVVSWVRDLGNRACRGAR